MRLGVATAVTAVVFCTWAFKAWKDTFTVSVRSTQVAVVFSRARRLVVSVVAGPAAGAPATSTKLCVLPCIGEYDVVMLPSSLLTGEGFSGEGVSMTLTLQQIAVGRAAVDVTLTVRTQLSQADLHRYVSIHGCDLPHATTASAVLKAFNETILKLNVEDGETLLSATRRERVFDTPFYLRLHEVLWLDAGLRCVGVAFDNVAESRPQG